MYATAGTLDPITLRKSAVTVDLTARGCALHAPLTGNLSQHAQAKVTSALRRNMIQMRYGMRLKGVSVRADDGVLTVDAVASKFAITQWLDSGDFVDAVDAAVRSVVN